MNATHRRSRVFPPTWVALVLLGIGCARAPQKASSPAEPLFFPPPPKPARVQYLGALGSQADLPAQRSSFADFVLGPEPTRIALAKPISAMLRGHTLYVCDSVLNRVILFDMVSGKAGVLTGDRGNGKIGNPNNLDLDEQGNLYVADKKRAAVLVFGPDGAFLHAWGRPGQAEPVDVKVGRKYLYVADGKDNQIELWDRTSGDLVREIGGTGTAPGQFYWPTNLALDAEDNLYVCDTGNFRVQKLSSEGQPLASFGQLGDALGQFAFPKGLDVDGRGRIYVDDARFCNVQIFDSRHKLLLFFGGPGPANGNLDLPAGLRVEPWPQDIPWLKDRLAPGFDPEFLAIVVSQQGAQGTGLINFYAVARTETE